MGTSHVLENNFPAKIVMEVIWDFGVPRAIAREWCANTDVAAFLKP
jgi:hypothetical protein